VVSNKATLALAAVQNGLSSYSETPVAQMTLQATLADIGIDSLALAELLFELEDKLGVSIAQSDVIPKTVQDVVTLIEPYVSEPVIAKSA
jgi:acyl carrier protein